MVAMRTGSTLQYLHTDHLGGVAAVTTSAGAYSTNQSYFAYGKKRAGGTLPTTINYTGQRLDGSGLVYMNARYYDPLVGMFISPDTIVPDAGVLIDYNRFAYARGNSLKYNDPSGHIAVCFRGGFKEQGSASSSGGSNDFWNACQQTLENSGYNSEVHGEILKLKNTQGDISSAVSAILAQEQRDSSFPVIVIGHSWGGAAALETAQLLDESTLPGGVDPATQAANTATIDLLFLIDAELGGRWMGRSIPNNVKTSVNLYAQAIYPDQWWNLQNGVDHFDGARNIASPQWVNFGNGFLDWHRIGHNKITTMSKNGKVRSNPVTFNLIADYTAQTLFAGRSGVQP